MSYDSAKQPRRAQPSVADNNPADKAVCGPRGDNHCRLHLYQDGHVVICKPRLDRLVFGVFSKSLTLLSLWMGGSLVLLGLHPFGSGSALWNATSAFMISIAAINLWLLAGPDDLDLDLRQRTYQYRRGLLYLAPTLTGTFDDISTVGVQRTDSTPYPQHLLMLTWNVSKRRPTCLGQFQTIEQAEAQRERLLEKLGL